MFPQAKIQNRQGEAPFGVEPKDAQRLNPRQMVTVYFIGLNTLSRKDKNRPISIFVPTIGRVVNMPEIGESILVPSVAVAELKQRTRWKDAAGVSHDGVTDSPLIAKAIKEAVRRGDTNINMEKAIAQANLERIATDDLLETLRARGVKVSFGGGDEDEQESTEKDKVPYSADSLIDALLNSDEEMPPSTRQALERRRKQLTQFMEEDNGE